MIGGEYVERESAGKANVRGSRRGKKWRVRNYDLGSITSYIIWAPNPSTQMIYSQLVCRYDNTMVTADISQTI